MALAHVVSIENYPVGSPQPWPATREERDRRDSHKRKSKARQHQLAPRLQKILYNWNIRQRVERESDGPRPDRIAVDRGRGHRHRRSEAEYRQHETRP